MEDELAETIAEHRFARHTTHEGDVCVCGWRHRNDCWSYHVAEKVREALGVRREYQVEGMWYRGPDGSKCYESSGPYRENPLLDTVTMMRDLQAARGGRIVTREAWESDWEPLDEPEQS
jgi:hypothetical protein